MDQLQDWGGSDVSHLFCFVFLAWAFFPFVDYGKYNICFQNVGLAGIRKESAWQADYLGLLAFRGCRQLRYGAGFSHSQVVLSCPGFNTEINKTALVCSIFSASWSSNQHIPMKAPWGGRAKKPLWGKKKKIFQCFFKFVPEVSFLCKWLAQDKTNKGVGRESKISMIPPETTQCPFVEPNSKHSDTAHRALSWADGTPQPYRLMQHQTTSWVFCLLAQVTDQSEPGGQMLFPSSLDSHACCFSDLALNECDTERQLQCWECLSEAIMLKLCCNIRKCGIFTR